MNDVMEAVKYLQKTLSGKQKDMVLMLAEEAKNLGATSHQLAPFYSLMFVRPSVKEATRIWKKLGKKKQEELMKKVK